MSGVSYTKPKSERDRTSDHQPEVSTRRCSPAHSEGSQPAPHGRRLSPGRRVSTGASPMSTALITEGGPRMRRQRVKVVATLKRQ